MKKDEYFDEEMFLRMLKVNNSNKIEGSQPVKFEYLEPDSEYEFGFVPYDAYGVPGKVVRLVEKTESFVFDGDSRAAVSVDVTSCVPNTFGGYNLKMKVKPNEFVSKYYVTTVSDLNPSYTANKFAYECLNGVHQEYIGESSVEGFGGQGVITGNNAYIWILAYDLEGKLCKVFEIKAEDTWK